MEMGEARVGAGKEIPVLKFLSFYPLLLTLALGFAASDAGIAHAANPRIGVIPVLENAAPSLGAARTAASEVTSLLSRQGGLDVVDSATVADAALGLAGDAARTVGWREVAEALGLDRVALLSVLEADVKYVGDQQSVTDEATVLHLYESQVRLRVQVIDVASAATLMDETVRGKQLERYPESRDTSRYGQVVRAVSDVLAILRHEDPEAPPAADDVTLVSRALEKATKKLAKPLRAASR